LADIFDFADPNLWRSNSFAALRPRLITHLKCVVINLEEDIAFAKMAAKRPRTVNREARLHRAREILRLLSEPDAGEPQ
jgi:hypothetical protein